jgi:lysophospholipase L1-like esterase
MSEQLRTTIWLAGDSTVQNCPEDYAPMAGWGQAFHLLFQPEVRIVNRAIGGRGTKSFIAEGRLEEILGEIRESDWLFIQFGHNDEKLEGSYADPNGMYKTYLKMYIDGARERGAFPVLITPVSRRLFDMNGKILNTHGGYPAAVIALGEELDVPVIDLCAKSRTLLEELGSEKSKKLFLFLEHGVHPNYPEGSKDNTHFSQEGAYAFAKLVAQGMQEIPLPIHRFLLDTPYENGTLFKERL